MSDGGKEFAVIDLVTKADLRDAMDLMTLKLTLRLGVMLIGAFATGLTVLLMLL